jgi:hypothetical protein
MATSPAEVAVSVESALSTTRIRGFAVKLASTSFELNVWIAEGDLARRAQIPQTTWVNGAIQIGESAGAKAFWSCDSHVVSILIGHDDQTWDVGVSVAESTIAEILRQARAVQIY